MALFGYATQFCRQKMEAKVFGATNFTPATTFYFAYHLTTQLTAGVSSGVNTISVADPMGVQDPTTLEGGNIIIAPQTVNEEQHVVLNVSGSGPYTLTLQDNLANNHLINVNVAFDPGPDCEYLLEPVGNGYTRSTGVTNNTTSFPAPSDGATGSGVQISWPDPSGTQGMATHVIALDDATAGNAWWVFVRSSFTVLDTSTPTPKVAAGNLQPATRIQRA